VSLLFYPRETFYWGEKFKRSTPKIEKWIAVVEAIKKAIEST
jgi:hypothetical protein